MDKFSLLSELLESLIGWDALGEVITEGLRGRGIVGDLRCEFRWSKMMEII